ISSFSSHDTQLLQQQLGKDQSISPAAADAEYANFEADLAARAQQLQLQGACGSAHLNWLLDACTCTLATNSSLASLLTPSSAHPHLSAEPHTQTSQLTAAVPHERADEVLSLLDACSSLQHMAEEADRQ
ncbi:hypothetical protein GOP47_0027758, partial [Adiantum capillus-veneris]